jgi:hypothetical protein
MVAFYLTQFSILKMAAKRRLTFTGIDGVLFQKMFVQSLHLAGQEVFCCYGT